MTDKSLKTGSWRGVKLAFMAGAAVSMAALVVVWVYWDAWTVRPELRKSVLTSAKDPDSAHFRNETVYERHMCGEVNLRNEYGGYTGYKRFISTKSTYSIEGDGRMSLAPGDASTEELIEELEWRAKQLKAGGVATEAEAVSRRFNRLWARHCGH